MAAMPHPETYEEEYRFWPWGELVERAAMIAAEIAPPRCSVMDYMCATGFLLSRIVARRPDVIPVGCDIHKPFVEYARQTREALNIVLADARTYAPLVKSSVILCTGGLHHLSFNDQREFIEKLAAECSNEAHLIIGEEVIANHASEADRVAAAVDLNCDLLQLGLNKGWPSELFHAAVDLVRADVRLNGEYKRDLPGWLSIISIHFDVVKIIRTWDAPSGGGDVLLVCRSRASEDQ